MSFDIGKGDEIGSDCEFFDFIQSSVGFTSVLQLTLKETNIEPIVTLNS